MTHSNFTHPDLEERITEQKGRGIFAINDIPKNTVVIREKPIVTNKEDNVKYLVSIIVYLYYNHKAEFDQIAPDKIDSTMSISIVMKSDLKKYISDDDDILLYYTKYIRNGFRFNNNSGMLFYGCILNHDCVPNTVFKQEDEFMVFTTTRKIRKDEEVTDSYLSAPEYNLFSDKKKKGILYKQYGFLCTCVKCKEII